MEFFSIFAYYIEPLITLLELNDCKGFGPKSISEVSKNHFEILSESVVQLWKWQSEEEE